MDSGLVNVGTSCWVSSSIQLLYSLSPIRFALEEFNQPDGDIDAIELYEPAQQGKRQKKKKFQFSSEIFIVLLSNILFKIRTKRASTVQHEHLKYMVNYMQTDQGRMTRNGFEDADEKLIGCLLRPTFYLPSNTDDSILDEWNALELPKIPDRLLTRYTLQRQNFLKSLRESIGHKTKSMPVCSECRKHPGDAKEYYENRWILAEIDFPLNIDLVDLIACQQNSESQDWGAQTGDSYPCRCQQQRIVNRRIQFHDCADYVIIQIQTRYNVDGSRRIPDVTIRNTIHLPAEFFPCLYRMEFMLTSVLCFQPKEIRNQNGAVHYVDHWVAYRKESPGDSEAEVMMLFDDESVSRHDGDVYRGASTIVFRKVPKVTRSSEKKSQALSPFPANERPRGLDFSESLTSPPPGDNAEVDKVSSKLSVANLGSVRPKKTPSRPPHSFFHAAQKLNDGSYLVKYQDRNVKMRAHDFLLLASRHPGKKKECQALIPGSEMNVYFGGNTLAYTAGGRNFEMSANEFSSLGCKNQTTFFERPTLRLEGTQSLHLLEERRMRTQFESLPSGSTDCIGNWQSVHNIGSRCDAMVGSTYFDERHQLEAKFAETRKRLAILENSFTEEKEKSEYYVEQLRWLTRNTGGKRPRLVEEDVVQSTCVVQQPVQTIVLHSDVTRCAIHAVFSVLGWSQHEENIFMKKVSPKGVLNTCDLKTLGCKLKEICDINLEKLYSEKKEKNLRKHPNESWMDYLRRQTKGRFIAHVRGHCLGIDLDNRIVHGDPESVEIDFSSWGGFGDNDKGIEVRLLTNWTKRDNRKHK